MAKTFDTLTAAVELETAGFDRKQAQALAGVIRTAGETGHEHLASKADLWRASPGIVVANAAITFGLLKLILP